MALPKHWTRPTETGRDASLQGLKVFGAYALAALFIVAAIGARVWWESRYAGSVDLSELQAAVEAQHNRIKALEIMQAYDSARISGVETSKGICQ